MHLSIRIPALVLGGLGLLALAGCDRSKDEPATEAAVSESGLLRYVPADTPYIFASIEPMPDALLDKLEPRIDRVLKAYQSMLQEGIESELTGADDVEITDADVETLAAVAEELSTLLSIEGLRGIGIDRDSVAVVYGNGLLPVLRLTVTDAALFEGEIVRLEELAGKSLTEYSLDEQKIRWFEAEEWRFIVALIDDQVVMTMAPGGFDDEQLSLLLGLTAPVETILDAGTLTELAETYDYSPYLVGFVDFDAIADRLIDGPAGLDAALFEFADPDSERPELSSACKQEVRSLVAVAPRLAFGYTDVGASVLDSHGIIELRSDIAAGLAGLPAAVPGLGADSGGLFSFGMSLDLLAAREFYEERLDALEAAPFECDLLVPMLQPILAGRAALQQPVPPMVYDFRGFKADITRVEGLDLQTGMPPEEVEGRIVLAMQNAPALLSLGAMFSPELAALQLEPGADPVPLEAAQLAGMVDAVHVALTDAAIGVSFGEGMEQDLGAMMAAEPGEDGTVFSFSMDAGRYYALIGKAAALEAQQDGNAASAAMQQSMQDVMMSFSELYDRMWGAMRLTERGIEFDSRVSIKD